MIAVKKLPTGICCIAILLSLSACMSNSVAATDGSLKRLTINVGSRERIYLLYSPATQSRASGKKPLVLAFHGGGGTARALAREIGPSLHTIADREGFYVAYPNAVDKIWDFGAGKISEELDVRIDDRAFFASLIDELLERRPIDPNRVFATGISRGGQASYFVACQFPDKIRAIAPVAMSMPVFIKEGCSKTSRVGVAILNGTDDPIVPYDGGQIVVGRRERGEVLPTNETVDFWLNRNGCAATATSSQEIDTKRDRTTVLKTTWDNCEHNPVMLYRIEGGGHTWPSGKQYLPRFVIGRVSQDIDGPREVWAFFSQFE